MTSHPACHSGKGLSSHFKLRYSTNIDPYVQHMWKHIYNRQVPKLTQYQPQEQLQFQGSTTQQLSSNSMLAL